jgi:hypothetical protein
VGVDQRGWRTVLGIVLISVAACSGGNHGASTGAIVGRMHMIGGTAPVSDVPIVGEIFVARGGTTAVATRTTTDSSGRFRLRVAPGSYDVSGSSSTWASPRTESVIVRPGGTVSVDLVVAVG